MEWFVSAVSSVVGVILLVWFSRWLSGGRLKERSAPTRRRSYDNGERVSVPILIQPYSGERPSTPPSTFVGSIGVHLGSQTAPALRHPSLAMDRPEFNEFWQDWAQGVQVGSIDGRVVHGRYWYTAVPRRFPPNESYLLLLNLSDWEMVKIALRRRDEGHRESTSTS
jgi:hypothetical protein